MSKVDERVAAVLFVPQTPQGELARCVREQVDTMAPSFGWKYRVVEKAGATLKSKLVKSNPWALDMCRQVDCNPCCMSSKKIECKKRNLVYETECVKCRDDSQSSGFIYVGETASSSRERLGDHLDDPGPPWSDRFGFYI